MRLFGPALLGAWALAIAQPLLDLFGDTPEFFVANGFDGTEVAVFVLALTLVGPALMLGLVVVADRVDARLGRGLLSLFVGFLATAFVVGLLTDIGFDAAAAMLTAGVLAGGVAGWLTFTRQRMVELLRYTGIAPVLFVGLFWLASPSGELIAGDSVDADDAGLVTRPAPVVVLVVDELPTSSLLRADGTIDDSLFPNFARLAAGSTFHRSASSVVPFTTGSLPTIMTGLVPEGSQSPTARDHPRSLFTLLGEQYDQTVIEQATDVCPDAICSDGRGFELERVRSGLEDSLAVYAQAAVPPSLRRHFPAVDQSWGSFIGGDDAPGAGTGVHGEEGEPVEAPRSEDIEDLSGQTGDGLTTNPGCPDVRLDCGPARFAEFIESIEPSADNTLYFAHVTTPHFPWTLTPDGQRYLSYEDGLGELIEDQEADGTWRDDPGVIAQNLQRHLYQVGAVDTLVGRLIDRLEEVDLWDRAVVVVVADHGVSFAPDTEPRRAVATNLHEIYNVPLFVKAPGQIQGAVLDDNALTVDIVPTIVDLLDIRTDWEFGGQSLVDGQARRPDKPIVGTTAGPLLPPGSAGLRAVAARNSTFFADGEGWQRIAGVGQYGDLVGRSVDQIDARPGEPIVAFDEAGALIDWDPDRSGLAPVFLHGTIQGSAASGTTNGLVAVNGRIGGVALDFTATDGSGTEFRALLDPSVLAPGENEVQLLVPSEPGGRNFIVHDSLR